MSLAGETRSEPPDLRLAGLAVAAWLTALAGLHLGSRTVLLVAGTAAGLTAVGALHLLGRLGRLRAVVRRYGWVAVAVGLGMVCGGAATGARLAVRDAPAIRALAEQRASITADLVVREDPRPIRSAGRPGMLLVSTELVRLTGPDGRRVHASVRLLVLATDPSWRGLLPGQHLTADGRSAFHAVAISPRRCSAPTAHRSGTARRPGRSAPPGRYAPACSEPVRRCPTIREGCCRVSWWATPADCHPPSRRTSGPLG